MKNVKLIYSWMFIIWLYLLNVMINFDFFDALNILSMAKHPVIVVLINLLIVIITVLCYPKNKKSKALFCLLTLISFILSLFLMPSAIFIPITLISTFKQENDTKWKAVDWLTLVTCLQSFVATVIVSAVLVILLVYSTDSGMYKGFDFLAGWVFQLPVIITITIILGLKKHWIWFLFPVIFIFPFIFVIMINKMGL